MMLRRVFFAAIPASGLCLALLCGQANASTAPARATAEAFMQSTLFKDQPEDMVEIYRKMPEFQEFYECIEQTLAEQNWTQKQHDALMEMTENTANVAFVDYSKHSDAKVLENVNPMRRVTVNCH